MYHKVFVLLAILSPSFCFAQIDTLKKDLKSAKSQAVLDKIIFSPSIINKVETKEIKQKTIKLRVLSKAAHDEEGLFLASHLGFIYNANPYNEDSCKFYVAEMKRANGALKSDSLKARILKNEAFIFGKKNEPEKELELLIQAAEGFQKYKDTVSLAGTFMNLGVLFSKRNNVKKKKFYEDKALELSKKIPGKYLYSRILLNRGFALEYSNPDSAINLARVIKNNSKQLKLLDLEALALHLESGAYLAKKNYKKSLVLCQILEQEYWPYLHDGARINSLFNQSEDYYYLGDNLNAEKQAFRALDIAENTNAYYSSLALHQHLSKVFENKKELNKALFHNKRFHAIKDSLYSISKTKAIQELETKYQTAQKERDIAILEQDKVDQNRRFQLYGFFFSGIGIIGILSFGLYFFSQRNKSLKAKNQSLVLEQKLFRAQIDPHFTYNTLSSIQSFFLTEGNARKGALYLAKFSKLLRNTLKQNQDRFVLLCEELETIESYLQLQKLRYNNQFDFEIIVDPKISPDCIKIPPMLIQPVIENAIIHGKVNEIRDGLIKVQVTNLDSYTLLVEVIDNGFGLNSTIKGNGLATNLIKNQLLSLSHEFEGLFTFNILEEKVGVKATLKLPYFMNKK